MAKLVQAPYHGKPAAMTGFICMTVSELFCMLTWFERYLAPILNTWPQEYPGFSTPSSPRVLSPEDLSTIAEVLRRLRPFCRNTTAVSFPQDLVHKQGRQTEGDLREKTVGVYDVFNSCNSFLVQRLPLNSNEVCVGSGRVAGRVVASSSVMFARDGFDDESEVTNLLPAVDTGSSSYCEELSSLAWLVSSAKIALQHLHEEELQNGKEAERASVYGVNKSTTAKEMLDIRACLVDRSQEIVNCVYDFHRLQKYLDLSTEHHRQIAAIIQRIEATHSNSIPSRNAETEEDFVHFISHLCLRQLKFEALLNIDSPRVVITNETSDSSFKDVIVVPSTTNVSVSVPTGNQISSGEELFKGNDGRIGGSYTENSHSLASTSKSLYPGKNPNPLMLVMQKVFSSPSK